MMNGNRNLQILHTIKLHIFLSFKTFIYEIHKLDFFHELICLFVHLLD